MFSHLATFIPLAALVAVAIAAPSALEVRGGESDGDCDPWDGSSSGSSGGSSGGLSGGLSGGSSGGSSGLSQCNTSDQYCCNSAITQTTQALGFIDLGSLDLGAGLTCDPISVIGIGGNSCTQQPVCCTDNSFNGLINIACDPINVNL